MNFRVAAVVLSLLLGGVDEDVKRAEEEYKAFSAGSRDFQKNAEATGKLNAKLEDVQTWLAETQKAYEDDIKKGTPAGRAIQSKLKNLETGIKQFKLKRNRFLAEYPAELDRELKKRNEEGLKSATGIVDLAEAILGKEAATVESDRRTLADAAKSIMADAKPKPTKPAPPTRPDLPKRPIASKGNPVISEAPSDQYAGKDKEDLRKQVLEAWKKKYPQDEIIKVVMSMKDWKRNVKKTLSTDNKSVELSDTSVLAARVLVKKDAENALIYMAFLNRDNLSESIRNVGVDTKGSQYVVEEIPLIQLDPTTAKSTPPRIPTHPDSPKTNPKADKILTEKPSDAYAGNDKTELLTLVREAWLKKHPQDEVLSVVLPTKEWKRTVKKTLNVETKSVELSDTSVLPAKVIVKKDAQSGLVFMAFINRDNVSNSIRNVGCDTKTSAYVIDEIPLKLLDGN